MDGTGMTVAEGVRVRRRQVFYLPGYDPFPPRRYRELYRKEGAAQAAISGYALDVTRQPEDSAGWTVAARFGNDEVTADVSVLVWSDIVRSSMRQGIAATYWQLLSTVWIYLVSGAFYRLMLLRKGPVIAALYPVAMLLAQLFVALWLAWNVAEAVEAGVPDLLAWVGWALGLALGVQVLRLFKWADHRLFAHYLMHDYAYSAKGWGANPPDLEDRMAEFGAVIRAGLDGEADEVLVVGHSSGAHLAVSILADLVREGLPRRRPALALLTLGQVVPMVSFLPRAQRLRADLRALSASDEITWVDVTAPGDGCSFALCDPVAVSGVAPADKRWPLVISAAFTQTLAPATWKRLRWRFFRLHFQYLCAFDRPGDYDYFRITAGPQTLAARYFGRQPSQSRIDVAVSGHRSLTA